MMKILKKYKEPLLYIVFGVATTLVNFIACICFSNLKLSVVLSTILAWFLAVVFAFFTNRKYVFDASKNGYIKQFLGFFTTRIATGVIDVLIMFLFVDILQYNDLLIKVLSNVFVIILNYIFSKFLVFKK